MSERNRKILRDALSADYEGFVQRLTRRLGSSELAREALHETFLRIDGVSEAVSLRSPREYLHRTAVNIVKDRRKSDRHLLSVADIASVCDLHDQSPDPSTTVEARLELRELDKALRELPERRRRVFMAAHIEQVTHAEIAVRFGINIRTVELDLRHTLEHLSRRVGRKITRRFGPRSQILAAE